jgi:hypothetical protein
LALKNHIRTLIDRAGVYSTDGTDLWGEAYTSSSTGRNGSVVAANTTARYDTIKNYYVCKVTDQASGDTTHDPSTFTSPGNAFDGNDATAATKTASSTTIYLAKSVKWVRIRVAFASVNDNRTYSIQTYNGSVWADSGLGTIYTQAPNTGSTQDITSYINATSIQGIRAAFGTGALSNTITVYSLEYGVLGDSVIEHTIPAGTFLATVSKFTGSALLADWESGCSAQMQIINAGSGDTTYKSINSFNEFTAFVSQPTVLRLKLVANTGTQTKLFGTRGCSLTME